MRYAVHVTGSVQGVGFRYSVKQAADQSGLTGWVQNEWDYSVRMEIQGPSTQLKRFLQTLPAVCRWAKIDRMETEEIPEKAAEAGFSIRL